MRITKLSIVFFLLAIVSAILLYVGNQDIIDGISGVNDLFDLEESYILYGFIVVLIYIGCAVTELILKDQINKYLVCAVLTLGVVMYIESREVLNIVFVLCPGVLIGFYDKLKIW